MGITFIDWFLKATTAQKISVMICVIIFAAGAIIGIYQLTVGDHTSSKLIAGADETKVIVQAIEDMKAEVDKLANTPAETVPITATTTEPTPAQVVSNTITVETPPQDYYIAEDGAHYESAPVYQEPTNTETFYEEPVVVSGDSGEGFDGNLGNGYKWDDTGWENYGTGISN